MSEVLLLLEAEEVPSAAVGGITLFSRYGWCGAVATSGAAGANYGLPRFERKHDPARAGAVHSVDISLGDSGREVAAGLGAGSAALADGVGRHRSSLFVSQSCI